MTAKKAELTRRIQELDASLTNGADYVFAKEGGMVENLTPEEFRFRQLFEIVKMLASSEDDNGR